MKLTTESNQVNIDIIEDIAWNLNAEIRSDYSGRGMYGKTCYGIVLEDDLVNDAIGMAAVKGLPGAKTDSMGLKTILYWPHVISEHKNEEENYG